MRQIIDLRGSLHRLCSLHVDIGVQIASAACGRGELVLTESEDHEQCLSAGMLLIPAPAPNGSNKTWTKDE